MSTNQSLGRIRKYLENQGDIRLAIVFGSLATGRARPDSDLDIAVAADAPLTAERKMALIGELASVTGRSVDLIDLATAGEPLLGQILAGGKRLLGTDQAYAELLRRHLFDQADFLPLRKRMLRERREAWLRR